MTLKVFLFQPFSSRCWVPVQTNILEFFQNRFSLKIYNSAYFQWIIRNTCLKLHLRKWKYISNVNFSRILAHFENEDYYIEATAQQKRTGPLSFEHFHLTGQVSLAFDTEFIWTHWKQRGRICVSLKIYMATPKKKYFNTEQNLQNI